MKDEHNKTDFNISAQPVKQSEITEELINTEESLNQLVKDFELKARQTTGADREKLRKPSKLGSIKQRVERQAKNEQEAQQKREEKEHRKSQR